MQCLRVRSGALLRWLPQRGIGSLPMRKSYDLVVVGSGPASQKCALDAAKKGKTVAIVDAKPMIGGVCANTGTIPSKTFREAVLHLTGYRHQGFYGRSYMPKKNLQMSDILHRVDHVVRAERDVVKETIKNFQIDLLEGMASFTPEPHLLQISSNDPSVGSYGVRAEKVLIAVGTSPARRSDIPFDGVRVLDSDDMLKGSVQAIPRNLIVIGAGVIGMEYASMINIIPGCNVTVVDAKADFLSFADKEIVSMLEYHMRRQGARFYLGETVDKVARVGDEVHVTLNSGKQLRGDCLLYAVGRQARTDTLGLEHVGLSSTKRGLLSVNEHYQTEVPYIYAAGDCIGFPALASTSMEQGRLASCHMWGAPGGKPPAGFPFGIYTVPEISMIGKSEQELTAAKIPYEVGIAYHEEVAKGQILGGMPGMLKLIFDPETFQILGIHCIGESATEMVHIGQAVMDHGGTIRYFMENVFNYPTFAEAYRAAAFYGLKQVYRYRPEIRATEPIPV